MSSLTYDQVRQVGARKLGECGIESASRDAKILMCAASDFTDVDLIVNGTQFVNAAHDVTFQMMLARRMKNEPIAYIIGTKEFWSLEFRVTKDVLIPRPETEGVVERALHLNEHNRTPRILDIGTGSGSILISLLHELKGSSGVGVDISTGAIAIAKKNAAQNGVASHSEFFVSDYASVVTGLFDIVVSNPPYIDALAMVLLPDDVKNYEPHLALAGGKDGLDPYRFIIAALKRILVPGGHVVFEIGFDQSASVVSMLNDAGLENVTVCKDLGGHDRIVSANNCV